MAAQESQEKKSEWTEWRRNLHKEKECERCDPETAALATRVCWICLKQVCRKCWSQTEPRRKRRGVCQAHDVYSVDSD